MDKNSHFTVHGVTTKTSRSDRKAEWQYIEIHYISGYSREKGHLVMTRTSSRTNRFGTRIQGIGITYTSLSDRSTTKADTIYPTTREASSILSRKENNCYISIVGTNSNAPQVAPRTTRGYPTSTAISLTQNFFSSVESQELVYPQKGRSEGDASEKMIASFTALNTQNPRRNKIYSHLFSIFPGKEPAKEHETKLDNEVTNRQAEKTALTKEKKKENKTHSPQLATLLYFGFESY